MKNNFVSYDFWKKLIFWLSIFISLILFEFDSNKSAILALATLNLVIFTKPLVILFPKIGLFKELLVLRRQFGQASAFFAFSHAISQFDPSQSFPTISNFRLYGILGSFLMFLLLITSNDFSTRLLKRNWFYLQKLIHPLYVFSMLHLALQKDFPKSLIIYAVLFLHYFARFLAYRISRPTLSPQKTG